MKYLFYYLILQFVVIFSTSAQEETASLPSEGDSALIIDLYSKPTGKDNKIVLQWKCRGLGKDGFSTIERSSDEKNFEVIGVIKASALQANFEFVDEKPAKEKNYYRIKLNGAEGKTFFSRVISADGRGSFSCKFYPNPVDKLLKDRLCR